MHHMKRDWEKKYNLLHKKNPSSPVYYFSPRQKNKHHFAKQSHWGVRGLLINRILVKHGDWKHMKIQTQEDKKLGLPFLFTNQIEKLFLNQVAITTRSL